MEELLCLALWVFWQQRQSPGLPSSKVSAEAIISDGAADGIRIVTNFLQNVTLYQIRIESWNWNVIPDSH